VVAENGLVESH
jgi:hypothetical protein